MVISRHGEQKEVSSIPTSPICLDEPAFHSLGAMIYNVLCIL